MNKKTKSILLGLVVAVTILLGTKIYISTDALTKVIIKEPVDKKFEMGKDINEVLTPLEMEEDILQFKKDVEQVHPNTEGGLNDDIVEKFHNAIELAQEPMSVLEFTAIMSDLANEFHDAHTVVENSYVGDSSLPMQVKFIDNKLYVLQGKNLEAGDQVIALGGIDVKDIYEASKKRIPSENIYWINYNFPKCVLRKSRLIQLDGEIKDESVEVLVKRKGETISQVLEYGDRDYEAREKNKDYKQYKTYPENNIFNPLFSYYLDKTNNVCHFVLKVCDNSPEYEIFLEKL